MQLARRVLLQSIWKRLKPKAGAPWAGESCNIRELARLWPLGRWSACREPTLIGEAFDLLTACLRGLAGLPGLGDLAGPLSIAEGESADASRDDSDLGLALVGSDGSRRQAEELLFHMFTDL